MYLLFLTMQAVYYKLLQLLNPEAQQVPGRRYYQLVAGCFAGQIFDSCPVDFTSEAGRSASVQNTMNLHHMM